MGWCCNESGTNNSHGRGGTNLFEDRCPVSHSVRSPALGMWDAAMNEKFDPNRMLAIIEQLKAEGRLPSAEEFVEAAMRIRSEYRQRVIDAIKQDKRRPRND